MQRHLKILALKQEFPFFKDCIDAFRSIGHRVSVVGLDSEDRLSRKISSFEPDFIFGLDRTGLNSKLLKEVEIPRASWFVDKPFYWITSESVSSGCIVFVYDRVYVGQLKRFGFEEVFYLPLATNPKAFRGIDLTPEDMQKYGCNISFVGKSIDYHSKYHQLFKDSQDRAIAEETIGIQIENPGLNLSDILEEVERAYHHPLGIKASIPIDIIEMCLEGVASSRYRLEMVEEIGDLGLDLYGDDGWKGLISKNIRFLGGIDYHSQVPKLYNASKIHLNLTRVQLKSAINMRIFDGSACGSFVLGDYRSDLVNLFDIEKEVVFFRDKCQMRELILYFLAHPEKRKEIADRAQKRVLNEHTFEHRMQRLVDIMVERFSI